MPASEARAILRPPPADWPARCRALSTTRSGGLALGPGATAALGTGGGSDDAAVAANRARLARLLGLPAAPGWLAQVHGTRVAHLDAPGSWSRDTDAAWTDRPGIVCAVLTADCLPVVVADAGGGATAVVHAGWRGLAAGVVERTVEAMAPASGRLIAWLGPAIGPRAFEVGPEVRAAFVDHDAAAATAFRRGSGDRWHADLCALAARRLRRSGVDTVRGGGHCTFTDSRRFFSHRRDGGRTGRMATFAWLAPGPAGGRGSAGA